MRSMLGSGSAAFLFCLVAWLGWLIWLAGEKHRHRRNLNSVPLRIHVNGTRGKSSVTRLIAAGLRAGGYRTLAKVTGTAAKFIDPDGSERVTPRRGLANIREYLAVTEQAAGVGAQALVVECMALQPVLQDFCEHRLLQSSIGVITNIRHDHEEVMGADLSAIAASLGRTIPERGTLVTTPAALALLRAAGSLDAADVRVETPAADLVSNEELVAFPFSVEAENLALALTVCKLAGVDRQQALAGMRASAPDAGNLTVREYSRNGHAIRFIDAMAANDPDSTRILWERHVGAANNTAAVLLHARADRRVRTHKLCAMLTTVHDGLFYLTGDIGYAAKCLRRQGVAAANIVPVPASNLAAVLTAVAPACGERARDNAGSAPVGMILFAAGNRKGFVE